MEASSEEDDAGKKEQLCDEDDFSLKLSDEEGKLKPDTDISNLLNVASINTSDAESQKPDEAPDTNCNVTPDTSTLMLPPLPSMTASKPSLCSTLPSINSPLATTAHTSIASPVPVKCQQLTSSRKVPIDMMPTIPLVPVQLPNPRGSLVNVATKTRGRPRGLGSQFGQSRQSSLSMRNRIRGKKLGSFLPRGGRRLVHSMSLDDRRMLCMKEDTYLMEDEVNYAHDDMSLMPSYQEKWPGKFCAFCCLAENSQLGQGEMLRYNSTPGFSPFEKPQVNDELLGEEPAMKKFKPSLSFREKYKYRKPYGEALTDFAEELSLVGFGEKPNLASIFNDTGHCFAHYMCALWSSGIELAADDSIACVDKAVVIAVDRKCLHCKKFGASIPCRVPDCLHWYHFPCATAAGAFMDLKSIAMVCQPHALKAKDYLVDMCCMMCDKTHPESSLLFCCTCGNHYHGMCLKPPIRVTSIIRTGWQCTDCKICQICRQAADEVMCGVCDRAYHLGCARPQGLTHSRTDWKCKSCRVCGDCGSRTPGNGLSSRWHANFTVCDSCYQLRNKGLACPVCKKAYRALMQKSMAQCSICSKHVHNHCDTEADLGTIHAKLHGDPSYEYQCLACRMNPTARLQAASDLIQSPDTDVFETESATLADEPLQNEDCLEQRSPAKKIASLSHPTSQFTGLSLLASGEFTCPTQNSTSTLSSSYSSLYPKGKPFVGRRGGFYPRPRGTFNKYTMGKRNLPQKVRGGKASIHTPRKGRGSSVGKGYRGYFNYTPVTLQVMDNNHSTGKEDGEENKLILVNSNDQYSLLQDICAMCGSFGQDQEGRLIACAQCGQCYHPYCANVKVNRVVLEKGWRCLDCTVCEGCGERNDEARLVLCEDCDISFHIYCMSPPLETVPAGSWKCKWCAVCQYCGNTSPGVNSEWQQNYSMCGPCFSMTTCPVCEEAYSEAELIIQCSNCVRWLHASDDMINTEDDAERCIEKGYLCLMCRSPDSLPPHLLLSSPKSFDREGQSKGASAVQGHIAMSLGNSANWFSSLSPNRSNSPVDFLSKQVNPHSVHLMDGTYLSEVGYHQIETQVITPQKKARSIKGLRASRGPSLDSTGSRDPDEEEDDDDKVDMQAVQQHWVFGMKEGTLLNAKEHGNPPILPDGYYYLKGGEPGTFILRKRRYRNIKTVGIGGFQVRVRAKKEEDKAREEAEMDPQALELRRKRSKWRTKKKIKLLEKFPSYIQEAFFGRNLMDTSTLEEEKCPIEKLDEGAEDEVRQPPRNNSIRLSQDEVKLISAAKEKHELEKCRSAEELPVSAAPTEQTKELVKTTTAPVVPPPAITPKQPEGMATLPVPTTVQPKVEEKKPKEEKVDDFAEDDENNDAIEALFGSAGSDFLSDDLVRDLINGDIKDESDRDQIDTDEDPGKLSDLLGPGFNLQDVADIMKTLPEDNNDESGQQVEQTLTTKATATPISQQSNPIHPTASTTSQIFSPNITTQEGLINKIPAPIQMGPELPMVRQAIPNPPLSHVVPQRVVSVQPYNFHPRQQLPLQVAYMQGNQARPQRPADYPKGQMTTHQSAMVAKPTENTGSAIGNVRPMGPIPMHTNKVVVSPYGPMVASPITPNQRPMSGQLSSHVPTTYPASPYKAADSPSSVVQPELPKTTCTNENQSLSLTLEEDEALGSKATKAAVLYANIYKPTLKNEVASNQNREKQIKRMWKNLSADDRKHYAQKARENKKEYIKNKQDQQKALKSQEKDVITIGAAHVGNSPHQVGNVAGPTHISAPSQMGMSSSQLSQPQMIASTNQPVGMTQTNRMQAVRTMDDGANGHVMRSQMAVNETLRPENLNQMNTLVDAQGNVQRTAINQFTRIENTDSQAATPKPCLPQRNMEDVYAQQRSAVQHRPDNQATLLRDVLQQQHGFNQSNRPQFRHPFPPVLGNQQVRLRLSGNNGNPAQGTAIYDPRMRYVVQQQPQQQQQNAMQQQQQMHQEPLQHHQTQIDLQQKNQLQHPHQLIHQEAQQTQIQHQPNPVELQQKTQMQQQVQLQQQQQIQLQQRQSQLQQQSTQMQHQIQQQNQLRLQQAQFRQQQNIVQVSQHNAQYAQQQTGQVHGPMQLAKQPHRIVNVALPTSSNEMPHNVQQPVQVIGKQPRALQQGISKFPIGTDDPPDKKPHKNELEDLDNSSDLNHMAAELLSSIDTDFKDLLEYATSDQEKCSNLGGNKIATNLFEGLCEDESKDTEGKVATPTTQMPEAPMLQTGQKLTSPSSGSEVIPQGPPSGPCSGSTTPGTPGSESPLTPSLIMGQAPNSLSTKIPHTTSPQCTTPKTSPMVQHVTQSFPGPLTRPLNLPASAVRPHQMSVASTVAQNVARGDVFHGQPQLMQQISFAPNQVGLVNRTVGNLITSDVGGMSGQQSQNVNQRVRVTGPQGMMAPSQNPGAVQQPITYQGPIAGQQMHNYHQQHMVAGPITGQEHPPPPYSCPPAGYPKQQEQPLLIEDIIEEERREQMKQQKAIASQQQALMQNQITGHDGSTPIRGQFQPSQRMPAQVPANVTYTSTMPQQQMVRPIRPPTDSGLHPALIQAGARPPSAVASPISLGNMKTLPTPPIPCDNPVTDAEIKQQQLYEKWLTQQMQLIVSQQKYLEEEISQLRKQRKSLLSRQRTLKKNGQELSEHDQTELDRVQKEAAIVQKHLDSCRKSCRQHSTVSTEYNNKKNLQKQKHVVHSSPTGMIGTQQQMLAGSPLGKANSPLYSTPQSPLLSHSPSSQHNLGMSPMVGSPHTPGPSPVHTPVPQHSPHGMTIPSALPSPIEAGTFSPQTRMPSPNTNVSYPSPQVIPHHLMQQSVRSRVPAHSPGTPSPQSGPASPHHMMVIKQGAYQPNQVMNQNVGQQVTLRHHYPQNAVPIRRPSGSGPIPSPTGPAFSPSHVPPSQSPLPYIAMMPSPIQADMRSPIPLSSPQMLMHGMDNPGTPRSNEGFGNPATPMDCVQSPLSHYDTMPPSLLSGLAGYSATTHSNMDLLNERSLSDKNLGRDKIQLQTEMRHSGGGPFGQNPPVPFVACSEWPTGLKGGALLKNRWGQWQIGLKGGSPIGRESAEVAKKSSLLGTNQSFLQSSAESTSVALTETRELISSTDNTFVSTRPFTIDTSHSAYVSASSMSPASVASQYAKNPQTLIIPERSKSEIPPSSRHQAVIGIPGGGAVSSQNVAYVSNAIGLPFIAKNPSSVPVSNYASTPETVQQSMYSIGSRIPAQECIPKTSLETVTVSSEDLGSSLVSAPIMSASVSSSVTNNTFTNKIQPSLVKDVNVIASVANVSNQVSNVLVSSHNITHMGTTVLPSVSSLTSKLPFSSTAMSTPSVRFGAHKVDEIQPTLQSSYASSTSVAIPATNVIPKGFASLNQQQGGLQYITSNTTQPSPQARMSTPYTLHHLPQNKVPVVLTSGNASVSSVQIITQPSFVNTLNTNPPVHAQYSVTPGQPTTTMVMQGAVPGQVQGTQVTHLPPLSSLNSTQLSKGHIIQSVGQWGQPNVASPGAHIIVQHQHNPNSVVLASNGSQVGRMVGQQVIMQQGLIRGSGVMVKSGPQVQGGVRMMMIHNGKPRTPTPPPIVRQTTPLMPPPAANRSPIPHAASPVSRVSPAPSPNVASPRSPQVNLSPLRTSPAASPQRSVTSTPPGTIFQPEKSFGYNSNVPENGGGVPKDPATVAGVVAQTKSNKDDGHTPAPNVLLKQLLQSASCSGNSVQHSGQLVLVRSSSTGNYSLNQSQLSHIASQVPNPSLANIQKNLNEMKAANAQPMNQTVTRAIQQPSPKTPVNVQVDLAQLGRSEGAQQLTGVLQGSHIATTVVPNAFSATAVHPVVLHQTTSGGQIVKTTMPQSYAPVYAAKAAAPQFVEQKNVPQSKTDPSPCIIYQGTAAPPNQKTVATPTQHLSLSDRIENNPSVKTEMCVLIPDNVSCSSAGDHTPELHTPNDSCDDPEEAKKAKKRAQNQARRKSQSKDNKTAPAQRMRQGSRVEEDYDAFIENIMSQLRAMPQMTVREPTVTKNFHSCPLYSCTDAARSSNKRENNLRQLPLEGCEGNVTIEGLNDYYNTQPFGSKLPLVSPAKMGHTQKQFYNQVFAPPKIELGHDESSIDAEVFSMTKLMGGAKRELDSPDTVLSSSSPESVLPESPPPFRGLRLVDFDDEPMESNRDRSISPAIPLLAPIPFAPLQQLPAMVGGKDNKENLPDFYSSITAKSKVGLTPALPRKDQGNVDVTLTLGSQLGQDISHVLRSLANLLNIPPPRTYKMSDVPIESLSKVKKLFKFRQTKDTNEHSIDMQSVLNGSVRFCKQCSSVVEQTMVSKSLSLAHLLRENGEAVDDFMFCSKICYSQFSTAHRAIHEKNNLSNFAQSFRIKTKDGLGATGRDLSSSNLRGWQNKDESMEEVLKVPQLEPFNRNFKRKMDRDQFLHPFSKRTKKNQYKFWRRDSLSLPETYEKPTDKEMIDLLFRLRITFRHANIPDDSRRCTLCHLFGDYLADGPSRLLNYDVDRWVHLNCGLWAEDVYETMNGSLMMMELGLKKSINNVCELCEQTGASVKCFKARCSKFYHLNCAVKEGCTFYKNKTVYCQEHINKGDKENELSTLAVMRRVFVERDESRQIASVVHHSEMNQVLRIGSLVLISIGQLLPQYLQNFHSPYCIYPIGYKVIRFYWSMRRLNKRCAYECSIHEVNSMPEFRITVQEEGFEDLPFVSRSPKGVWNKILEPIAELRQSNNVVKLFPQYISGEDLFGLTEPAIVRILESMPGVDTLTDYSCKYGSNPLFELPLAVNPSGCARAETIVKGATKRHHGIRTAAGTVKAGSNSRSAASMASFSMNYDPFVPFGKPYTHSRFFQYKKMTNEWRSTVFLARSKIQGLGLYAAKDIEKNTMIIEYIGEIIRGELSEVREKRYEAQNRGIYMFRLDDARVVDATVSGGLARYVNHSCDPNCYTETIEIERDSKIVICSNRKISRGEELAYDYKFDEEEDHKIACLCGADNCRKWMN